MSRRLHAPKIWIECEVRDKNGKLIHKRKFRGMSWVGNIIGFLCSFLGIGGGGGSTWYCVWSGYSEMRDVNNYARNLGVAASNVAGVWVGANAPAGRSDAGIVVGTSDTPVTIGDIKLGAQIPHGTGAGQLVYDTTYIGSVSRGTNTYSFYILRPFINSSGGTVTVKEVGIYVRVAEPYGGAANTIMFARDVLTTPIDIPDGATLTVRYIISYTI